MEKELRLREIAYEIEACRECRQGKEGKVVPGEGSADASLVFVGEAPGREEAKTGRPFVGRSGKLLRALMDKIGLSEKDIYITSPVKYLPKRGTPTKAEIRHGRKHLLKQLAVIEPHLVVLLGRVASQALLERTPLLKKEHGQVFKKEGKQYFLTYHPAAALRSPQAKKALFADFQKLKSFLS